MNALRNRVLIFFGPEPAHIVSSRSPFGFNRRDATGYLQIAIRGINPAATINRRSATKNRVHRLETLFRRGGGFPIFHSAIDDEGAEGEEGGDKDYCGATDGPVGVRFGARERNAKCDEQDAMNRTGDFHRDGHVPDVFEGHGDAEQEEK